MKKTEECKNVKRISDDMRSEYQFDYSNARPNRFAKRAKKEQLVVVLDSDISHVFQTSESVNNVLRAIITNMSKYQEEACQGR